MEGANALMAIASGCCAASRIKFTNFKNKGLTAGGFLARAIKLVTSTRLRLAKDAGRNVVDLSAEDHVAIASGCEQTR